MPGRHVEFTVPVSETAELYTVATPVVGRGLLNRTSAGHKHFADITLVVNHWPTGTAQFLLNWCVEEDEIPSRFQTAVLDGIHRAIRQPGVTRAISRLRITVIGGNYCPGESHEFGFAVVTLMAFREALAKAEFVPRTQNLRSQC